jgi:hypothetical protein
MPGLWAYRHARADHLLSITFGRKSAPTVGNKRSTAPFGLDIASDSSHEAGLTHCAGREVSRHAQSGVVAARKAGRRHPAPHGVREPSRIRRDDEHVLASSIRDRRDGRRLRRCGSRRAELRDDARNVPRSTKRDADRTVVRCPMVASRLRASMRARRHSSRPRSSTRYFFAFTTWSSVNSS